MTGPAPDHDPRFQALAEASPAAIVIVEGGRITYANPALAAITEYSREELLAMDPRRLLHPGEREASEARAAAARRDGPVRQQREVRIVTRSGRERWVAFTSVPFPLDGHAGVLATGVDITERKTSDSLVERRMQLEAVGRLAGGVAHDFNNLLLVISGEAERLIEGLAGQPVLRQAAENVARAATRAATLTEHLLAFGRKQMLIARPVDVNEVILELGESLWEGLGNGVATAVDLARNLPPVRVDRPRLEQALISVVANAGDAVAGRGRVVITTDVVDVDEAMQAGRPWLVAGQWVRVRVTDNGPGVAPDLLSRVFEPFFTTKPAGEGSGLGLSTVYGIVKQSGGFVWIENAPQQGATVTILLPPVTAAAAETPAPAQPAPARPHVLLVEDQDGIREMLTTMLKKQGFQVTTAATAERALEMAPGLQFDLLLTDVMLPGMTGPELARQLRAMVPEARVLFMSGYTGDALRDQAEFGDERSFIQKPFASKALFERIRSLLDSPPAPGDSRKVSSQP